MPRPPWTPTDEMRKRALAIKRKEAKRAAADQKARTDIAQDIAALVASGAAVAWLSQVLDIDRKTLYERLGTARAASAQDPDDQIRRLSTARSNGTDDPEAAKALLARAKTRNQAALDRLGNTTTEERS